MCCPRMGLALCVLLHSSLWVECVEGLCVAWLMHVGVGERKNVEISTSNTPPHNYIKYS